MNIFFLGVVVILGGGALSLCFCERNKASVVIIFTALGAGLTSFFSLNILATGIARELTVNFSAPIGTAVFRADALSAFFILIISVMGFLTTIYAKGYMSAYLGQGRAFGAHFLFLPILILSMMMVAVSSHVIVFLIMWEIMSLSSFFLMTFENEKKDVLEAGIYYITAMHICVALLVAGFSVLSLLSGSLDFASFKPALSAAKPLAAIAVFAALFIGFAIKAGLMPFHTWLPLAHPAAPSHVSAIMSGVMIKLGIYGILRLITFYTFIDSRVSFAVLAFGLITGLFGIYFAMAQRDIKRLLAYSSIENIGIMTTGIGLGLIGLSFGNNYMAYLGFAGAFLHLLNHSIFKELMFFGAGSVYLKTHTRDMEHLGGLAKQMPYTAAFFFVGSAAISALPPLNGFIGELVLYLAMFSGITLKFVPAVMSGVFSVAVLSFTGAMAVVVFTKMYSTVFSGTPRNNSITIKTGEYKFMTFAMAAAVLFCVVIGVLPQYFFRLASIPASLMMALSAAAVPDTSGVVNALQILSVLFISAVIAAAALYLVKKALLKDKTAKASTWGCGYQAPSSRIQYTSSSFAATFLKPIGPFMRLEEDTVNPEGLFPRRASYASKSRDLIAAFAIKPALRLIGFCMRAFSWIQNGNTQQYILYGLVFLIISIVWAMGAK
jgi:formate hydrogenlyase subunit 3/multisubunit Na+/H+ antiporter MnhD subunit